MAKHDITDIYRVRSRVSTGGESAGQRKHHHSDAYHRHFRGYSELRHCDEYGRIRIERYYTAPWIVCTLPARWNAVCRGLYLLLAALSVALLLFGLTRDVPATHSRIAAIPGFAAAILTFLQLVTAVDYCLLPKKMTMGDHGIATTRLKRISAICAAAEAMTAILLAVLTLADGSKTAQGLFCAAILFAAAACAGGVFLIERRMPYAELPNDTVVPEGDSYEIW